MNFACCFNCAMAPAGFKCYGSSADDLDCKDKTNCTYPSNTGLEFRFLALLGQG